MRDEKRTWEAFRRKRQEVMKNKKASHKPKAKRASQVNKENVDPRS